jgi:hypothetical protein
MALKSDSQPSTKSSKPDALDGLTTAYNESRHETSKLKKEFEKQKAIFERARSAYMESESKTKRLRDELTAAIAVEPT